MSKHAVSGNKPKKKRLKASEDSKAYRPGLSDEEKTIRHRKAQSQYYARSSETRERRRAREAERRTAAKTAATLKRHARPSHARPKKMQVISQVVLTTPSPPHSTAEKPGKAVDCDDSTIYYDDDNCFKDPRALPSPEDVFIRQDDATSGAEAGVGTAPSPTSDEDLASRALAELATRVAEDAGHRSQQMQRSPAARSEVATSIDYSILDKANQLSALESSTSGRVQSPPPGQEYPMTVLTPTRRVSLPTGLAPLTRVQKTQLRLFGSVDILTPVQKAQIRVADLNAAAFSSPTVEHVVEWSRSGGVATDLWDMTDLTRKEREIAAWRVGVIKAMRTASLAGEDVEFQSWAQV
ncbi:hypothetical protein C8R43DRAFT_1116414 [Mycena crocata]|nr:hypothetical protein C8R43DRAFT_1116414 [Mycena crocata]